MDQKILWDCHMHSSFSSDSDTPMEEMIQTAVEQGLKGICFTEHFDPDYPDTPEDLDFRWISRHTDRSLRVLQMLLKTRSMLTSGSSLGFSLILQNLFPDF